MFEVIRVFVLRDLIIRYRHTVLGLLWLLIRPVVISGGIVFLLYQLSQGQAMQMPLKELIAFILVGLLPWNYLAAAASEGSASFLENHHLLNKVYFSRASLPIAKASVCFLDFLGSLLLLIVFSILFPEVFTIGPRLLLLPLIALLLFAFGCAIATLLSILILRFADLRHLVPFIVQFGIFISPIGFRSSAFLEGWSWIIAWNPATFFIESFRWSILANYSLEPQILMTSFFSASFLSGLSVVLYRANRFKLAEWL